MERIRLSMLAIYNDRKEIGTISQRELARAWKCSQPTVSNILNGTKGGLTAARIEAFCDVLGLSLRDLEKPVSMPAEPQQLREYSAKLKRLREISPAPAFRNISRSMDDWLEILERVEPKERPTIITEKVVNFPQPQKSQGFDAPQPAKFVKVPYYDRIPAGDPVQLSFEQSFWMDILHSSAKPGWWTTRVWGDSMLPEYRDGDIVLMDRDQEPRNGNIVAALIDGSEATFKVFDREGDEIILTPLNQKYKARRFHASQVIIQGVLVELVRRPPPERRSLRRKK